ncbi:hypothetical protein RZE82_05285 [Mollicutes bacterium LVI A0039]|nr:hypothetical protein RZE82_05285 [Mollicutes bacterium LVI A0039]
MAITSKIINTILIDLALVLVVALIYGFTVNASAAVASPSYDDYDNIYATLFYYAIFWGASILNIITVCCQKTKTSKKAINFVVVTIISIAMFVGVIGLIAVFEMKALEEGLDTMAYEQLMSPELTSYVFNGIFIYGVITAIFLLGFIISPFLFKNRIDAQPSQHQAAPQQTAPQPQSYTNESKSPFEL